MENLMENEREKRVGMCCDNGIFLKFIEILFSTL